MYMLCSLRTCVISVTLNVVTVCVIESYVIQVTVAIILVDNCLCYRVVCSIYSSARESGEYLDDEEEVYQYLIDVVQTTSTTANSVSQPQYFHGGWSFSLLYF